jgi:hypothetical protein
VVRARDEADDRVGAEHDQEHVAQEQRPERRSDQVQGVGVEDVEQRTGPQQQAEQ